MGWTARDLPRLDGKIIAVTGANSGIGFEAARALAGAGAHVVLACRSEAAAAEAIARIRAEHASASVASSRLDLADLASVRAFARALGEAHDHLDVLINNAGVMALPYGRTADGFEMQLGTNHLGHFALTGLLLERILRAPSPRIVTLSSSTHWIGKIHFDDLHWERGYSRWPAYGQAKLANLIFAFELDRRLRARGSPARSVACHPGYASTNLQLAAPRMRRSSFWVRLWGWFNAIGAQSAHKGAWPTLFAAAAEDVRGGDYFGPGSPFELWGSPKRAWSSRRARDQAVAARLWEVSEELTGVRYAEALGG